MHQMVHFDQCEYQEVFLSFICLCKRLDFKVKQLGLMNKYWSDADIKMHMKKLAALSDGDVALHLTFHLRCGMWLEDMSKGLHVPIMR